MKQINTNILRTLAIALMAMVCMTGKAQDFTAGDPATDPLAAWYNGTDAYILRTIDDDHTVIDAMKALQEVNSKGGTSWNDYSSYYFYLVEDVDLSEVNWEPLGTSSNPFCSSFYCYAPSWNYSGTSEYPYNTKLSPAPEKVWANGYKLTYNISEIDLSSYEESIDNFISSNLCDYFVETTDDEISVYTTMDNYDSFSSNFMDSEGSTLVPTVEGNSYTYDISKIELGESDIDTYISESLSNYFVVKDEENSTITIYTTEDLSSTISCKEEYEPTNTPGTLKCRLLPTVNTSPGYFYDGVDEESGEPIKKYYSTNGHIGTCAIKNLDITVSAEDDTDAAGFFGYVNSSANLYGFTFENCSVTNNKTGGYAGMLYGVCEDNTPSVGDLFIGTSSKNCTVTATNGYAGGVCGANYNSDGTVTATLSSSSYFDDDKYNQFSPALTISETVTQAGAILNDQYKQSINKIYVTVTGAEGQWNWISSTNDETESATTYVHKEAGSNRAFAADDEGNYGDGTADKPYLISTAENLKNLVSFVDGSKTFEEGTYTSGMYFKQTAEIEVTLTTGIGTEAIPFSGFYDGNGKTVTVNIGANGVSYDVLFSYTAGATISDLKIVDNGDAKIAGIIGTNKTTNSSISRCIISVPISDGNSGLVGGATDDTKVTVLDCYNVADNQKSFCSASGVCVPGNGSSFYSNTTATGEGTSPTPLMVSSLSDLNTLPECGLYYQLADNIFVNEDRLVGPTGNSLLPAGASNKTAYIEKFCGTIDGNAKIIAGITDKALFGTITGNTEIKNIGFVNCYNATNKKVNLANSVTSGTLIVDKCYGDGYLDFSAATTKTDCYSYSDFDAPVKNFTTITTIDSWQDETLFGGRSILRVHSISVNNKVTDAIGYAVPKKNFTYVKSTDLTDTRLRYKYFNIINGNAIENLYIVDITARMNELGGKNLEEKADIIKSTEFNGVGNNVTVKNVTYRRIKHNDWESVCLPFAFKMSDVENSDKFAAYTYSEKDDDGASFTPLTADATIAAGQPVLIYNSDKANTDFIVSVSKASGVEFVTTPTDGTVFKGALQHIGFKNTTDAEVNYKIDGTKTTDGGGTLLHCTVDSWIYPFRTYLDFGTVGAKSIRFSIYNYSDDDTTAIEQIISGGNTYTLGTVYGLDGRKISDKGTEGLKSGLYIVNGKKVMVK